MLSDPVFGLVLRSVAVLAWFYVCARVGLAVWQHHERRLTFVVMGTCALAAAIGSLASGVGAAQRAGAVAFGIDAAVLAFVANMGAGFLLGAALIVATSYRPPEGD